MVDTPPCFHSGEWGVGSGEWGVGKETFIIKNELCFDICKTAQDYVGQAQTYTPTCKKN